MFYIEGGGLSEGDELLVEVPALPELHCSTVVA